MPALLEVDVTVDYPRKPRALDRVRFEIGDGEPVAVLGESGSGKSTLVLAILGLLDTTGARVSGRIAWRGEDLLLARRKRWREIRGKEIAFVPQSATAALNPAMRIGSQMAEAWRTHEPGRREDWRPRTLELFERVSLPVDDEFLRRFPSQISVGQAQRVLIAMALLHRPRLLISDEPTSAVDPATRDGIRALLRQVRDDFDVANLLITHDVATVAGLCTRAIVLSRGRVVRAASMADLPCEQANAYTQALNSLYQATGPASQDLVELSAALGPPRKTLLPVAIE
jgi:ABC-type glutathione transport system ATPase component